MAAMNRNRILLIFSALIIFFIIIQSNQNNQSQSTQEPERIEVEEPVKATGINKQFEYPLRDGNGTEVSKIKFDVNEAELRNEIIIKGKKATSIKGRTFFVVNLKITNEFNKSIDIQSRDYFRLAVKNREDEWLAPDVHNDPVEVQAISTKLTRVGFPVDEGISSFVLQVGEIGGEKEKVEINF